MRIAVFAILALFAVLYAQDYKTFLKGIETNINTFSAGKVESELKGKAGIQPEKNLQNVIDKNKEREILDLLQHLQSSPVKEYTCYQVRKVNVNVKYRCSLTGEVFSDEQICNANCIKQHDCVQSACYQVQACQKLSSGYLCPIGATQCNSSISLKDGISKVTINSYTDGLEISQGRVRFCYEPVCGNWVSIFGTGVSTAGPYTLEVNNLKVRLCHSGVCGNWITIGQNGISNPGANSIWSYRIESFTSGIKLCNNFYNICGNLIPVDVFYTCPLGKYTCIKDGKGNAYCSPYPCNRLPSGKYYCTNGNITSAINDNVLGMWWCSGDQTWLSSQDECLKNCPYYTCTLDGNLYTGLDTCQMACREVGKCEVY